MNACGKLLFQEQECTAWMTLGADKQFSLHAPGVCKPWRWYPLYPREGTIVMQIKNCWSTDEEVPGKIGAGLQLIQLLYFAVYNMHFFVQIFEGKVRMRIIHGWCLEYLEFVLVFCDNVLHKISCTICSNINAKIPL